MTDPNARFERLPYFSDCVGWPKHLVDAPGGLCDMIDAKIEITRSTFLKHVDQERLEEIEEGLGYAPRTSRAKDKGIRMTQDYHVRYYRAPLLGTQAYFFVHSAIEYVFANEAKFIL